MPENNSVYILATRCGVLSSPSRVGSSPIASRMSTIAFSMRCLCIIYPVLMRFGNRSQPRHVVYPGTASATASIASIVDSISTVWEVMLLTAKSGSLSPLPVMIHTTRCLDRFNPWLTILIRPATEAAEAGSPKIPSRPPSHAPSRYSPAAHRHRWGHWCGCIRGCTRAAGLYAPSHTRSSGNQTS